MQDAGKSRKSENKQVGQGRKPDARENKEVGKAGMSKQRKNKLKKSVPSNVCGRVVRGLPGQLGALAVFKVGVYAPPWTWSVEGDIQGRGP